MYRLFRRYLGGFGLGFMIVFLVSSYSQPSVDCFFS